jgi:hypothetical protein
MAVTDPVTHDSRRFSIRVPRPLWFGMAAVVLSLAAAVAGDPADEEFGENASLAEQQRNNASQTVDQWVFGVRSKAVPARDQLATLLRQKIAIADRICGLTDIQRRKIELAGRGDSKRILDCIYEIGTRFQLLQSDADKVRALAEEAEGLRRGLIEPGLSKDVSLFVKSLERTLTAEQAAKYEPLRVVFRAGGIVRMWQHGGTNEAFNIQLVGTTFTDDDLGRLSKLPALHILNLQGTRVTDAGLAHLKGRTSVNALVINNTQVTDAGLAQLKGLTNLEWLWIDDTPVTDAGLAHLRRLTNLKELSFGGTQITDAGVTDLKLALPELTIKK